MILFQLIAGLLTLQVLTAPLFQPGGYLVNASAHAFQLGGSVLISLTGAAVTLAIAALAYPILRSHSHSLAVGFLSLSILGASLSAAEQVGVLGMVEFSVAYSEAGDAQREFFEVLRSAGALMRNGAHYVGLLIFGATTGVWYFCLLRFRLLPAVIPAFGLLAVALQLYSISQPVLGGEVQFLLLAPIGLAQLTIAVWLLIFGFPVSTMEREQPDL